MWTTTLCTWSSKALFGQNGALLQACRTMATAPKSNLAALRKNTGYSLSLCKKALAENNQDLEAAQAWLKVLHFKTEFFEQFISNKFQFYRSKR